MSGLKKICATTEISSAVQPFISDFYRAFINMYGAQLEQKYRDEWKTMKAHYEAVANGVMEKGVGMDYELTRLRNPRFTKIQVVGSEVKIGNKIVKDKILVAQTNAITVSKKWDLGQYRMYFPYTSLVNRSSTGFHFIPLRDPRTYNRHPHHRSHDRVENPLVANTSNCYGSFGGHVSHALYQGRLVDLLIHHYLFLSVYNPGSPLVRLSNVEHAREKR